jgi:hypothetical protein
VTVPTGLALRAAEEITREGARDAARDELREGIYRAAEPSLADRVVREIREWIFDRFADVLTVVPGGLSGVIVLLAILALVFALLRYGAGPLRRSDALTDRRSGAASMTAADYRAEAERLAAAGEHKEAVRARFRAIVRELEQRAVLDPRPGRTAGEVAAEAGSLVPLVAGDVRSAADVFGEVWYGGSPATAETYARVTRHDDVIRGAKLSVRA